MSFEGEGHDVGAALADLVWGELSARSVLTLGKPTPMRGETVDSDHPHARKMTWSELFFDLIFVTGVRRLGDMLRENLLESAEERRLSEQPGESEEPEAGEGEAAGIAGLPFPDYAVLFFLLWSLWVFQANYGTRWGANDAYNFVHFGLYMAGVVMLVMCLGTDPLHKRGMYLCAGFSYTIGLVAHLRIRAHFSTQRQAGRYAMRELALHALKIGLAGLGCQLASSDAAWLWPMVALAALPYLSFPFFVVATVRRQAVPATHLPPMSMLGMCAIASRPHGSRTSPT